MIEEAKFMVRVSCMTHNHVNYISDAMNGFVMQQTSFPYLCIIVDDASTDGEPEVIKKFLNDSFDRMDAGLATEDETDEYLRIFARHKENKNCYFCALLLKYNHYSIGKATLTNISEMIKPIKYVALCEGDDFWTDPMKLQKQVEFLEGHENFSICFHEAKVFNQAEGRFVEDDIRRVPSETDILELAKGNYIHTMTVVYRNNSMVREDIKKIGRVVTGDYVLHMLNAKYGRIKKLPDCMAVYRLNQESVWGTKDDEYRFPRWNEMLIRIIPLFEPEVQDILHEQYLRNCNQLVRIGEAKVRSTKAYRLGKFLLNPFGGIKNRKNKRL